MFSLFRSALVLATLASVSSGFARATSAAPTALPLTFEENRGQAPPQYKYVLRHGAEALFFRQGADFVLPARHGVESKLRLELLSTSSRSTISAAGLLGAQSNYLIGSDPSGFITHVPNYSEIRYEHIYSGVTLDFYGNGTNLEHDFTVAPYADPSSIAFRWKGAKSIELSGGGDLLIQVPSGTLILKKPIAYQTEFYGRRPVAASFHRRPDGSFDFRLGHYDRTRPLVIDPVFTFSTYLDGNNMDEVSGVTTDASGNIYVTGNTASADFPTQNPYQSQLACATPNSTNCSNAFISKLDPTGNTLLYSTYLGGNGQDQPAAIALDASGNIIIGGLSSSTNFPNAGSLPVISCQTNDECYFLASFTADGSALNYSGLVGGAGPLGSNGNFGRLAVDASGNAYLAGWTDDSNFQITAGTLASSVSGYPNNEGFVLKVSPTGTLLYSTVIPGNATPPSGSVNANFFMTTAIAVDSSGQVTIAGNGGIGLPTTAGVLEASLPTSASEPDPENGFVLQLNATASAVNYATYVPAADLIGGMAVDKSGDLYITGSTYESDLAVSANAYQKTAVLDRDGSIDSGFIAKLNNNGTAILAATYLDGTTPSLNNGTSFQGLALDSNGNVFVGGTTGSSDFPLQNPFTSQFETSDYDADLVLAEMSSDLSTLEFGSFLSSTYSADPYLGSQFGALSVDANNNLIVAGLTYSSSFPTSAGAYQTTPPAPSDSLTGYVHTFVSKLNMATAAPSFCPAAWSVAFPQTNALSSAQQTLNVTNCGNAPLNFSSLTSSASTVTAAQSCGSVAPGATCAVTFTFAPINDQLSSGTVSLADNAAISPQSIQVSGQGVAPDLEPQSNPFSFGHLLDGVIGPAQSLLVQNYGNANLNISSIAIGGTGFSIADNACSNTVGPGGFCYVAMIFSPPSPGTFTGTLTLTSNDPVHPTLVVSLTGTGDNAYGVPTITEANGTANPVPLPTMQINNGAVTLSLVGTNFYPQSVVQFNGVPQQSSWGSNTSMQATIAASSLTALGEFPLTVVNPSPGGGSVSTTITTYQLLPINPNFITYVSATGLLYAAMPSSDATNPNTVLPINPNTGATGAPIPVGQNPALLAPSSDGSYLYVANATDLTVQRINLSTNAVDETFPYPPDPDCSGCTLPPATDLKSVPGAPDEVILGQGSEGSLYNSNGLVNYLPATANYTALAPSFDSMAFVGDPVTLYSLGFYPSTDPFFTTVQITSLGLEFTPPPGSYTGTLPLVGNSVVSDGTLLYTDAGGVWSPATQTQIGSFTTNNFYDTQGDLAIDTTLGRLYLTGDSQFTSPTAYVYDSLAVFAYGLQSLAGTDTLTFPQINASENYDLTRWGTNGFAFVVSPIFSGTGGIYLFNSTGLAGTAPSNPVPTLASIAPNSVTAGAAAQVVTLAGTGFVAASIVSWNGNALAASYISPTELTASIPATDLAAAGSAQITVVNPTPGGGTSSALTFTINPAAPTAVLSGTTLSFGSVIEGTSSAAQPVTLTNSGTAALSITSIAASGSFSETNSCGSSLAIGANCQISITFAPTSATALTGAVTIMDNAPGSPQTVSLSGTGVAAFSLGAASGGSPSASVSSGGTATYNLAVTAAVGFSGSVALGCSGAPEYAACTVSRVSANLTSGGSANFSVTVTTTGSNSAAVEHDSAFRLAGIGIAALLLLPFLMRVRREIRQGTLVLAMIGLLLTISGCGGGGNQTTPPPQVTPDGTYTLTVTATASSITTQQTLTLIVQ